MIDTSILLWKPQKTLKDLESLVGDAANKTFKLITNALKCARKKALRLSDRLTHLSEKVSYKTQSRKRKHQLC